MLGKLIVLSIILLGGHVYANSSDVAKPELFEFGESVHNIKDKIEPFCVSLEVRSIIPVTAPLAKESQEQIDCHGFSYAGKKRKVELVFQDDQLDIVWILFPKEEKEYFVNTFTVEYGDPSFVIDYGTVFMQANAAVRNEPSEVLFVSDRQMKIMLEILAKQQSQ